MAMEYGLQLFSLRDVAEQNFDEALRVAAELGFSSVEPAGFFGNAPEAVAAMLQKYGLGVPTTHTGLRELTETVLYFREKLKKEGMELMFHNHIPEFLPNADGQIFFEELWKRTDLRFELDTFWAYNAGLDPVELMERLGDRLCFVHLKDGFKKDLLHPEGTGRGMALGEGEAPVAAVHKKAIELGLPMIVESGDCYPTGPLEVARCMNYLQSLNT